MARLARPTATASNPSTPIPATTLSPALAGAVPSPSSGAAGVATPVAGPSRTRGTRSSARRSLAAAATAPSSSASASTSAAASPASSGGVDRASSPAASHHSTRSAGIPKSHVAPKAHGLRNALNARDRTPCPFPSEFGGSEHCGVADEDEADDVLMAICAATAGLVSKFLLLLRAACCMGVFELAPATPNPFVGPARTARAWMDTALCVS